MISTLLAMTDRPIWAVQFGSALAASRSSRNVETLPASDQRSAGRAHSTRFSKTRQSLLRSEDPVFFWVRARRLACFRRLCSRTGSPADLSYQNQQGGPTIRLCPAATSVARRILRRTGPLTTETAARRQLRTTPRAMLNRLTTYVAHGKPFGNQLVLRRT